MSKFAKLMCIMMAAAIAFSLTACQSVTDGGETTAPSTDTDADAGDSGSDSGESTVNLDGELSGTIDHWVWGDYEIVGAKDFNDYYPDINVNYISIPQDEYPTKLLSTAASGLEMPDVVNLEMTPRGALVDMDVWERLDAEPYNLNPDDLVDFCIPLISNPKGEIVSVQIDNCVGGYVYNRELANKYFGTDDPEEMEALFPTLDSFVDAAPAIAAGGDLMFAGADDAFMAAYGLMSKEPWVTDGKLTMDNSILPTYQFIEQLRDAGALGMYVQWTPAWNASFAQNNIVFIPAPSWHMSFTIKANDPDSTGKYGFMSPPGGGFSWGGTSYSIPKDRPDEQKALAWTYIKWFTMSEEGQRCFVREQATPGLYKPAYDTDIYDPRPDDYFGGQDVFSKLLEIAENPNTQVRPMTKYDRTIEETNNQIMRELENTMSAEDAFAKLKQEVISKYPDGELSE